MVSQLSFKICTYNLRTVLMYTILSWSNKKGVFTINIRKCRKILDQCINVTSADFGAYLKDNNTWKRNTSNHVSGLRSRLISYMISDLKT